MRITPAFLLSMVGCLGGFTSGVQAQMLVPQADAFVNSAAPGANNSRTLLKVQAPGMISYVRFDLSSLPALAGGIAKLAFHVNAVKTAGPVSLYLATGGWQESSITWSNRPPISATPLDTQTLTAAMAGGWIEFDVSAALDQWISNPATNFGVAIVGPASPRTYVYFDPRESGYAPTLSVSFPMQVTVGPVGRDYTSPVMAAQNALAGDSWCVAPAAPDQPCTIKIDAGNYVLGETLVLPPGMRVVGSGKSATFLLAVKGLESAVRSAAKEISDLSIVNNQDDRATRAVGLTLTSALNDGDLLLSRVAVRTAGAAENLGIATGQGSATLVQVDVAAGSGRHATGIGFEGGLTLQLVDSTVAAAGATDSNTGIRQVAPQSGSVRLKDTAVMVAGGANATGLSEDDEGSPGPVVIGGEISVHSPGIAVGIANTAYAGNVEVTGTRMNVVGGVSGVGIFHTGDAGRTLLDGASLFASHVGVESGGGRYLITDIKRSHVTAGEVAVRINDGQTVLIHDSIVKATSWLSMTQAGRVEAAGSVLDGAVDYAGSTKNCTAVYDRNYTLLPNSCPVR